MIRALSLLFLLTACGSAPPEVEAPAATAEPIDCDAAIADYDAAMATIVAVAAQRQPWDDLFSDGVAVPVVDRDLLHRQTAPAAVVTRNGAGSYAVGGSTVFDDAELRDRVRADLETMETLATRAGRAGGRPARVAVVAGSETPVEELNTLLETLHSAGVQEVDLVVGRTDAPDLPQVEAPAGEEGRIQSLQSDPTTLPPLRERVAACPIEEFDTSVPIGSQAARERQLATEALRKCACAVSPKEYAWAARLRYVPHRLTNVIPVRLPARLQGETWADAAQLPIQADEPKPAKPSSRDPKAELERNAKRLKDLIGK